MELGDLMHEGEPRPYIDVQRQFKEDPATQWAAYVVGALLVLMHEKGMRFTESFAFLVSSDVPEGLPLITEYFNVVQSLGHSDVHVFDS